MARDTITAVAATLAGAKITGNETAGSANGAEILWNPRLVLIVENTAVATRDFILTARGTEIGGAAFEDKTITLDASSTYHFGSMYTAPWRGSDNYVHIDYDSGNETDFKVYAIIAAQAS